MKFSISYSTYTEVDRFRQPVEKIMQKAECFIDDILIKTFYKRSDDTDLLKYKNDTEAFMFHVRIKCQLADISSFFKYINEFK